MADNVANFPTRGFADDREGIATLLERVAANIRSGDVDAELCILITETRARDGKLLIDVFGGHATNATVVGLMEYAKMQYVLA